MQLTRSQEDVLTEFTAAGARNGDRRSFDLLYRQWQPKLTRFAVRLTRNPDAVVDIMQDSWVAIAKGLPRLNHTARFKAWAYRIVSNKCRDWIRREQARRRLADQVEESHIQSPPGSDPTSEAVSAIRRALRFLPEEQRTILMLFYIEEWSVRQIAALFRIPEGTVKSRLYHARKTLKGVLEKENNE